jgi:hypothetical protein
MVATSDPNGGWGGGSGRSGAPPTVESILSHIDLIVRGVVGNGQSHLSDDEREIWTEYPIANPTFLFQRKLTDSAVPGVPPTIAVTILGGTTTVLGKTVVMPDPDLPSLPTGTECLFLLHQTNQRYFPAGQVYGAFSIIDGKVSVLTRARDKGFATEYQDTAAAQVIDDLLVRVRSTKR